jgi:hypothetical protein
MLRDWPPEGLALTAAIERLFDQTELDREASQLLATVVDVRSVLAGGGPRAGLIAAGQGARAAVAVERFKPIMMAGRYRAQGRQGSPAAPLSEIPASAWPHVAVDLAGSRLQEHHTGTIWWDSRILAPIVPEPVALPAVGTSERFRSAKDCRDWYFEKHPAKLDPDIADAGYVQDVIKFCRSHGFKNEKPPSVATRHAEYRRRERQRLREQSARPPTKTHKRPTPR